MCSTHVLLLSCGYCLSVVSVNLNHAFINACMYFYAFKLWLACIVHMYVHVYFTMFYIVPKIEGSNVTVFENDGVAVVQFERSEQLDSDVMIHVATVDGTAIG